MSRQRRTPPDLPPAYLDDEPPPFNWYGVLVGLALAGGVIALTVIPVVVLKLAGVF